MTPAAKPIRRIATEEAFSIPEVAAGLRDVARSPSISQDLILVQRIYDAKTDDVQARLLPRLLDLRKRTPAGHGQERRGYARAVADRAGRADV